MARLFTAFAVVASVSSFNSVPAARSRSSRHGLSVSEYGENVPYKEAAYDPEAAETFYRARPLASLRRLAQLVAGSGGFVANVILDKKFGREEKLAERRSTELVELLTTLGPTFIKVGQALSARTDLVPAQYASGLTRLQDAVPPFSAELGREVIERELGVDIDAVFSAISPETFFEFSRKVLKTPVT